MVSSTPPAWRLREEPEPQVLVLTFLHNCLKCSAIPFLPLIGKLVLWREDSGAPSCNYQYNCRHGKRQGVFVLRFQNGTVDRYVWLVHCPCRRQARAVRD